MLVWAWWSERLSVGLVLLEVTAVIAGAAHVPGAWTGLTILTVSGLLVAGVFVIRLSPPRRRINQQVENRGVGQLVEYELVKSIPHPGVLPLAQRSPRGVPGTAPQLLGQIPPAQPVSSTNKIPSTAARSSTRGRPPGPRAAGRGGIKGSISSQSRSATSRRCFVFATPDHDPRPEPKGHAPTHPEF